MSHAGGWQDYVPNKAEDWQDYRPPLDTIGVNRGPQTSSPGYRYSTGYAGEGDQPRVSGGFIERATTHGGRALENPANFLPSWKDLLIPGWGATERSIRELKGYLSGAPKQDPAEKIGSQLPGVLAALVTHGATGKLSDLANVPKQSIAAEGEILPKETAPAQPQTASPSEGTLAEMNKPAVADMSTVDARMRSLMKKLQKEKEHAPAEEDLTAKAQQSLETVIDNKVLGVLKKQGEGLTVSMQQLSRTPELSRFTPEQLMASAVRLRDAGKVWGHTAKAAGEATESIYGIASR